jgi:hypothetical protein
MSHRRDGAIATAAGLRDAALAAVCFFGVLRISEALALTQAQVSWENGGATLHISKSKTDQEGVGRDVFIPRIASLGTNCPHRTFRAWWQKAGLLPADVRNNTRFCFVVTKGPRAGQRLADAALRAELDKWAFSQNHNVAAFSTHSLRNGGAVFWRAQEVPSAFIQRQGGWKNEVVFNRVYAFSDEAERKLLFQDASRFALKQARCLPAPPKAVVNIPPIFLGDGCLPAPPKAKQPPARRGKAKAIPPTLPGPPAILAPARRGRSNRTGRFEIAPPLSLSPAPRATSVPPGGRGGKPKARRP